MVALIVQCILWILVPLRTITETRILGSRHDCKLCRYDLSGLPEDALCPECGSGQGDRTVTVTRTKTLYRAEKLYLLSLTLPVAIVYAGLGYPIAEWLTVYSYELSGYSHHVASMAAHYRDLPDGDFGAVLMPVGPAIALSPLLALLPTRRGSAIAFMVTVGAASLVALCSWTLPYMNHGG